MKTKEHALSLLALLKNSILEEFTFREGSVTAKWKLYFNNPAGELSRIYTLSLHNISFITLNERVLNETEVFGKADLQTYPDLQLLILGHDPAVTGPEHTVLICRIIHPSAFQYAVAKLDVHFTDFTIRDAAGSDIPLSRVVELFSNHNQQLLQNPVQPLLKNQFNTFLRKDLQEVLKNSGFQGRVSLFYLPSGYTICALEVVKGRWNSALGYTFILRYHLFGGNYDPAKKINKIEDLFTPSSVLLFTKNIGPLNGNEGVGYAINGRIQLRLLRNIVVSDLKREVLNITEQLKTKEAVINYLESMNQLIPIHPYTLNLAILQGIWGNKEAALNLFEASNTDSRRIKELQTYYNIT